MMDSKSNTAQKERFLMVDLPKLAVLKRIVPINQLFVAIHGLDKSSTHIEEPSEGFMMEELTQKAVKIVKRRSFGSSPPSPEY